MDLVLEDDYSPQTTACLRITASKYQRWHAFNVKLQVVTIRNNTKLATQINIHEIGLAWVKLSQSKHVRPI